MDQRPDSLISSNSEKNIDPNDNLKQVIVKYRGNYPAFMQNVKKYLTFINQIYSQDPQVSTYLEAVDDGLICIYKSLAIFQALETTIPQAVKDFCQMQLQKEKNFLLEGIENGEDFPKEGYLIQLEIISHTSKELYPYFKAFHTSMHPDIKVEMIDQNHIQIVIPNINAFQMYANLLYMSAKIQE